MSTSNMQPAELPRSFEGRFTDFYRETRPTALRFVQFRARGADHEGILEESFLLVWKRLTATGELSVGWFYQVLRNKIGDFYRSTGRTAIPVCTEDLPEVASPYDLAHVVAQRADVRRVLSELSTVHAEVLLLAYWCDLSGSEAARALGVSEGAFRARLVRARRAFAEEYGVAGEGARTAHEGVLAWIASSD
ncbi:MAG: sigma-70 family RNA polymerase sigma factor [Arachnia sp.]